MGMHNRSENCRSARVALCADPTNTDTGVSEENIASIFITTLKMDGRKGIETLVTTCNTARRRHIFKVMKTSYQRNKLYFVKLFTRYTGQRPSNERNDYYDDDHDDDDDDDSSYRSKKTTLRNLHSNYHKKYATKH
jgi:hypothetical protein